MFILEVCFDWLSQSYTSVVELSLIGTCWLTHRRELSLPERSLSLAAAAAAEVTAALREAAPAAIDAMQALKITTGTMVAAATFRPLRASKHRTATVLPIMLVSSLP